MYTKKEQYIVFTIMIITFFLLLIRDSFNWFYPAAFIIFLVPIIFRKGKLKAKDWGIQILFLISMLLAVRIIIYLT